MFDDEDSFDGIDSFDDAKNGFVEKSDLLEHLLLIRPGKSGTRKGENSEYVWVECEVHILDGRPHEMFFPQVPAVLEGFQFSGQNITPALQAKLPKAGNGWKAGWLLARLEMKKSQRKGRNDSWVWGEITDEDKAKARAYAERVKAEAAKRSAQAAEDAFA